MMRALATLKGLAWRRTLRFAPIKRWIGRCGWRVIANRRTTTTIAKMIDCLLTENVALASPEEIDAINILQATFLAMRRAVAVLGVEPVAALIDGNAAPDLPCPTECIIDGDAIAPLISAASIIAKVERDTMMTELRALYPGYGFSKHKGYGTPEHQRALAALGPCAIHRLSFKPVRLAAEHKLLRAAS